MSPTPVVLVAGDFVPTGGMDRANYAFASYLARRGHPVQIVAHRIAAELTTYPNVQFRPICKPFGSDFLGEWGLRAVGRRTVRGAGGRVVVNGGNCPVPDVNWVHYVHAAYRPHVVGSPLGRLKVALERPFHRHFERHALRQARVVIVNSRRTRQDVIELLGVAEQRVHVVPYGIDAELFRPAESEERRSLREKLGWPFDRPMVLFLGALGDRRKGFDTAFNAWVRLCRSSDWDAVLGVIGQGAELPQWARRVREAGLADRVRFLGFRTDVPHLLRAADALIAPTRYEAYGLGVHEALCCGLPAIVSAAAGVAERYPPTLADLLLPDPDDAADLAARLTRWRADPQGWRERVAPLSHELRQWTWDDMARTIWEQIA